MLGLLTFYKIKLSQQSTPPSSEKLPAVTLVLSFQTACEMMSRRWVVAWPVSAKKTILYYSISKHIKMILKMWELHSVDNFEIGLWIDSNAILYFIFHQTRLAINYWIKKFWNKSRAWFVVKIILIIDFDSKRSLLSI